MSTFKSLLRACMVSAACLTASVVVAPQAVIGAAQAQEIQDMVLGSADAPVTVVEYASFTCPHCASFHEGVFKDLKRDYIDTGKVKFVFREAFFNPAYGLRASMVARCGGETRFFGITEIIFEKQSEWTALRDADELEESLFRIGRTAGLTDEQLAACIDPAMAKDLQTWSDANLKADGVQGTPSFRIDGEEFSNMSFEEFSRILDEKLGE